LDARRRPAFCIKCKGDLRFARHFAPLHFTGCATCATYYDQYFRQLLTPFCSVCDDISCMLDLSAPFLAYWQPSRSLLQCWQSDLPTFSSKWRFWMFKQMQYSWCCKFRYSRCCEIRPDVVKSDPML
jgi:hypothetical protein